MRSGHPLCDELPTANKVAGQIADCGLDATKELARNNFPVWQSDSVSGKALAAGSSNSPAASAQWYLL